jgi:hypothetical protein
MARKPKNLDLPGMEDRKLTDLHEKALEYAAVRDERMVLTKKESELKAELIPLMQKYGKDKYCIEGVEIELQPGEPSIKVKVTKDDTEEGEGDGDGAGGSGEFQVTAFE